MADVIVYSTPTCPWCNRVKLFLKEKGVAFEDKNVAEDKAAATEMITKTGGQIGVPVIDAKGTIIIGFDKAKLKTALGLKDESPNKT